MKKLLAIAVLAIACLTANAQCYLGAGIGFGTTKADYHGAESTTIFQISPEFGYNFNSKWAVGLQVHFTSVSAGYDGTAFGGDIYGRYSFAHAGCVKFFGELALGYAGRGGDLEGSVTSVSLRPGISAKLSKNINLEGRMNLFNYSMFSKDAGDYNQTSWGIMNADYIAPVEFSLIFDL